MAGVVLDEDGALSIGRQQCQMHLAYAMVLLLYP